jgi:hypothetical protein
MKRWNGTDATGRYQYPQDDINDWNMTIDERGTVYYIPHDGTNEPRVWCPAADLTRHLHRLEQIAARR